MEPLSSAYRLHKAQQQAANFRQKKKKKRENVQQKKTFKLSQQIKTGFFVYSWLKP